jgi:DNA mismatch endonuclease, patch repair protein
MADVLSKAKRSQVMAAIRSSGNQATELKLVALLRSRHITGWRRNQRLPGKPDFVFRKQRLAVFVDGCFWHGCPRHCRMPKSHRSFWTPKISRNRERDRAVVRLLKRQGWRVVRIWEHALLNPMRVLARLKSPLATTARHR